MICSKVLVLFCSVSIINADVITVGNKSYVSGKRLYCGSNEVLLSNVTSNNKAIVVDAEDSSKMYVWSEGNTCRALTAQDYLDISNSPNYYTYTSGNEVEIIKYKYTFLESFIPNTEAYNSEETYYELSQYEGMVEAEVDENTQDLDNYFLLRYFRNQETTVVNPNATYYKIDSSTYGIDVFVVADTSEVNENNINEYYILTTLDDATDSSKTYTYNETKYNEVSQNSYQTSVEVWDGKMYLISYQMDLDTCEVTATAYYDENGNEITEYKNTYVSFTDSYRLNYSYSDKKLRVYDKTSSELLAVISFDENNVPFSLTNLEYNGNLYFLEIGDSYITNYVKMYEVLDGNNQTFSNENITIRFNGNYKLFTGLLVNGEELDSKYYTTKEGSTIVTLDSSYLRTLNDGNYTLTATYSDGGSVDATFVVSNNPQTLDSIYSYAILSILSIIVLSIILNKKYIK